MCEAFHVAQRCFGLGVAFKYMYPSKRSARRHGKQVPVGHCGALGIFVIRCSRP